MSDGTVKKGLDSRIKLVIAVIICFPLVLFFLTGFVTVQPLGALPDGVTIWYYRPGTELPFITSPDGLSLKWSGELSLMRRMQFFNFITGAIEGKIISRMPYSKILYLISTGGKEFHQ